MNETDLINFIREYFDELIEANKCLNYGECANYLIDLIDPEYILDFWKLEEQ